VQHIEEQKGKNYPSLIPLYESIGKSYLKKLILGESHNYQEEMALVLEYFQKAIRLREKLNKTYGLEESINNLGWLSYPMRKFAQALEIAE
jgi:hypothetical protein